MFQQKSPTDPQNGVTIISKGCSFEGRLYCRGVSRIGGKIHGSITAEGTLIIEKDAAIHADIQAHVIIIQGTVQGKIEASSKAELLKTSVVEGELMCASILVEEGSTLNASVFMTSSEESGAEEEKQEAEQQVDDAGDTDAPAAVAKVEVLGDHKKRQESAAEEKRHAEASRRKAEKA